MVDGPGGIDVRRIGLLGAGAVASAARTVLASAEVDVVPVDSPAHWDGLDGLAVAAPWGAFAPGLAAVGVPVVGVEPTPVAPRPGRVPAAGWLGGVTSLVAAAGLAAATGPHELHVAAALPEPGRARRTASRARRGAAVDVLLARSEALVGGETRDEIAGQGRRLAWFPRPVGPAHAVSIAMAGTQRLRDDHPTLRTARSWVAARSLVAEVLQATAAGGRDGRLAAPLLRWADRGPERADDHDLHWAVVAEVREDGGAVVRAWANGSGVARAAGTLLGLAALRVPDRPDATHVLDLGAANELLDGLADRGVLRWSVARPTPSVH